MTSGSMGSSSSSSSSSGTGSSTRTLVTVSRRLLVDEVDCSQETMDRGSMCASPG